MSAKQRLILLVVVQFCALPANAAAPPGRYTFPDEGLVYDTKTQLTWQREVVDAGLTRDSAISYCASLSVRGSGWRLPKASELQTLVDPLEFSPAIDPVAFPNTPPRGFWAANHYPGTDTLFYFVDFEYGFRDGHPGREMYLARCVR